MQDISVFDIVVIVITLLLGLKGLFRGFIKEVFGLIGIVGGIFIASRLATTVGEMIAPVLALENTSSIQLMGFIVGLIAFWIVAYVLGLIISKIFALSGLGLFDKLFGFIFGAFKVFLIFSIIIYALSQIQTIKEKLDSSIGNTITYPILVAGGAYIIKLDQQVSSSEVIKNVDKAVEKSKQSVKELTQEGLNKNIEEFKEKALEKTNEMIDSSKKALEKENQELQENKESTPDDTAK
ncbi:MAG: CvpA family protein [Arcobacteraceae bacterium]